MVVCTPANVGDIYLGAAYEGPPAHVHGVDAAIVLDHLRSEAADDAEGVAVEADGVFSQPRWSRERAE